MRLVNLVLAFLAFPLFASSYDTRVLLDNPVLYLPLADRTSHGLSARFYPSGTFSKTSMPNGDRATRFDGSSQYVEISDAPSLSVRPGGALTVEAWIRPSVLDFPNDEGDGYVHWAGKGEPSQHEYALRMYSRHNSASRPNRISGYAFNLAGGLGSGSYFQDTVRTNEWIHVVLIIQTRTRPGTVLIYKNGVLRDTTPLSQFDVVPRPGTAPLRIGTRDFGSFFKGAIGKFAVYAYPLSASQIQAHYDLMQP